MTEKIGIHIEQEFRDFVDQEWARKIVRQAIKAENVSHPYEMSLVIAGSETVQKLNRDYRSVDEPTDVLAFCMLNQQGDGSDFVLPPDNVLRLGEVIISYPEAVEQAKEQGHSTERELALLIIHGILHLLGYDHEKPEEVEKMRAREKELLENIAHEDCN